MDRREFIAAAGGATAIASASQAFASWAARSSITRSLASD